MLSGAPTVENAVGTSFQVTTSYKTKTGQQLYILKTTVPSLGRVTPLFWLTRGVMARVVDVIVLQP